MAGRYDHPIASESPSAVWRALSGGVKVVLGAVVAVTLAVVVLLVGPWSLPNPLGTSEVERDHAVVLAELEDLSRYVAATGRFQAVVDIEQDADYLPDFIKGERVIFLAEGDVEAYVDFSELDEDAFEISDDGTTLTVTVPEPVLSEPRIDPEKTEVVASDRGLIDRIDDAITSGDPSPDQELYVRANDKIAAAAAESDLRDKARDNTESFLVTLGEGLGFDDVVVRFEDPADVG